MHKGDTNLKDQLDVNKNESDLKEDTQITTETDKSELLQANMEDTLNKTATATGLLSKSDIDQSNILTEGETFSIALQQSIITAKLEEIKTLKDASPTTDTECHKLDEDIGDTTQIQVQTVSSEGNINNKERQDISKPSEEKLNNEKQQSHSVPLNEVIKSEEHLSPSKEKLDSKKQQNSSDSSTKKVDDKGHQNSSDSSTKKIDNKGQQNSSVSSTKKVDKEKQENDCSDNNNNDKDISKIKPEGKLEKSTQLPNETVNRNKLNPNETQTVPVENTKEKKPATHHSDNRHSGFMRDTRQSSSQVLRSRFAVDNYGRTAGYNRYSYCGRGLQPKENIPARKQPCTFTNGPDRSKDCINEKSTRVFTKKNGRCNLPEGKPLAVDDTKKCLQPQPRQSHDPQFKQEKPGTKVNEREVRNVAKEKVDKKSFERQHSDVATRDTARNKNKEFVPMTECKTDNSNSKQKINQTKASSELNIAKQCDNVQPKHQPNRRDGRDQPIRMQKSKTDFTVFRRSAGFIDSKKYPTDINKTDQCKTNASPVPNKRKEHPQGPSTPIVPKVDVKQEIKPKNNQISEVKTDAIMKNINIKEPDKSKSDSISSTMKKIESTKPNPLSNPNEKITKNVQSNDNKLQQPVIPETTKETTKFSSKNVPKNVSNIENRNISNVDNMTARNTNSSSTITEFAQDNKLSTYITDNRTNIPIQQSLPTQFPPNLYNFDGNNRQYPLNDAYPIDQSVTNRQEQDKYSVNNKFVNLQQEGNFVQPKVDRNTVPLPEKLVQYDPSYPPPDLKYTSQYYPNPPQTHGNQQHDMMQNISGNNILPPNTSDVNTNAMQTQAPVIPEYKPQNMMVPSSNLCNYPVIHNQWNLPTQDMMYPGAVVRMPHLVDAQQLPTAGACYGNNTKNFIDPNYAPRQWYCMPVPCMHTWDPHMKYMNPMFPNPQNTVYNNAYQNQQIHPQPPNVQTPPENANRCFSPIEQNRQYPYVQQQTPQQQQPMQSTQEQQPAAVYQQTQLLPPNSAGYGVQYKCDNFYYGDSQGFKTDHPQSGNSTNNLTDAQINSDELRKGNVSNKQEGYPMTFDPRQFAFPPPIFPNTEQRVDPYGSAKGNFGRSVSVNYRDIPQRPVLNFNSDWRNAHSGYNQDTVENETSSLPIISPRDCMNYGANFPRYNTDLTNSTSSEDSRVNAFNKKPVPKVGCGRGRLWTWHPNMDGSKDKKKVEKSLELINLLPNS